MPRAKLRREPCDCADCLDAAPPLPTSAAGAAARQDPPPKSLVLCLSGAVDLAAALREADTPHLDAAVRAGWAGLLACRAAGPPLPLQLLGCAAQGVPPPQRLPDRFKQLRAVLLTDTPEVAQAGEEAGCYAVHSLAGWPAPQELAARIGQLLGLQAAASAAAAAAAAPALAAVLQAAGAAGSAQQAEQEEEGDDVIDMLLLALDAARAPSGSDGGEASAAGGAAGGSRGGGSSSGAVATLEWADELLRCLNSAPGFRDAVLLSLVVGPGAQPLSAAPLLQQEQALLAHAQPRAAAAACEGSPATAAAAGNCPLVRRPLQSFQFAGQQRVEVDGQRPALVAHRLPGVIRVDAAAALDLEEVLARGAAGCVLAERLLPEVAYKLGRAAKYGA